MAKIAFIGAGSMVFAKNLIGDVLSYPAFADGTIALMDIDERRLSHTAEAAERMVELGGVDCEIRATTDRGEALDGADYVLNTINVGGAEPFENEIRIPERYGVDQAIGDTLGPGGVFRGLRTIPTMLEIARDMEERCPDAPLLNYTNPMAIVCWAVDEATDVDVFGLCHSVPHTIDAIADYVDAPVDEIDHWTAGINHMSWVLELERDGEDLYPALREAGTNPETYDRDTVRFEMLRHFGAFPTESSHHLSEYVPYFRTDPDVVEAMTGSDHAERMETAAYLEGWTERSASREEGFDDADLAIERSEEYASRLIHSMETGTERRLNLNVPNRGAIANLPDGACVEVPCLVDGSGVHPCAVGDLPAQLAALNRTNVHVQERAVSAALGGDRNAVHQAVKLDPLTAASLTLEETHGMTAELLEANAAYLPDLS